MPGAPLPPGYRRGSAKYVTLPAGTLLWRTHGAERLAEGFAPPNPDPFFAGHRFDGTPEDPYSFHYSAERQSTALAEVFLRDRPYDRNSAMRLIPFSTARDRMLSALETTVAFRLISLFTAEDMSLVCQDRWLLEAEGAGFIQTRQWTRQLRAAEPDAQGLMWMSRRDWPHPAYVLFGDRCGSDPLKPAARPPLEFNERAGLNGANEILRKLSATFEIPPLLV